MAGIDVAGYLAYLGVPNPGPPSVESLCALHRAHVDRIAYNTLEIHLGRRTTVDPAATAARIISCGRAGYCLHLNGAFGRLLTALGYNVLRHRGGVLLNHTKPAPGADGNHLALTVHGLPSLENPAGSWFVDVGLGDAIYDPLPLIPGVYRQGPFTYRLGHSPIEPLGWRFDHDPTGHFAAMDFVTRPIDQAVLDERHAYLTTSPDSVFLQTFLAHRREASGAYSLRGCVLTRIGSNAERRVLATADEWFGVLGSVFGIGLDDISETERRRLWKRVCAAHEHWLSARPVRVAA